MIPFPAILLRLGLALLLGSLIGLERESHDHPAGMRTYAIVALGSALFTVISVIGFSDASGAPHAQFDTRIAAYVVAGIGFIGAGSIFIDRDINRVRGLTTAAGIWLIAAIGMACGAGWLLIAVATTLMGLVVLTVLRYVERLLLPRQLPHAQHLNIETTSLAGHFIGQIYDILAQEGVHIEAMEIRRGQDADSIKVTCRAPDASTLMRALDKLRALSEVRTLDVDVSSIQRGSRV